MRAAILLLPLCLTAADVPRPLDTIIDSNPLASRSLLGIHVTDLKTGKTVYARNENRFFLPASNMKLFTSALALQKLGPAYRFETRILQETGGDLVLSGSGDPSLNGRTYPYRKDAVPAPPLRAIAEMADQVVSTGLTRIPGDIVGDDRLYPWAPYPPNWSQDDVIHESGAPISALSVADNFITVTVSPGALAGDPAVLSLSPPIEYFSIDNRVTTVAANGPAQVNVARMPGTRQVLLTGRIPLKSTGATERIAVDDPALFAAFALYDALTLRGVTIAGRPVARHRAAGDPYQPPEGAVLATHVSPPLNELLQMLDKVSENLHAELMLRAVGNGTRESGLNALTSFLSAMGAPAGDARFDDGSGLSRNAEVTPKLLTRLLAYMYGSEFKDAWMPMLPVGGEDGTLSRRLCCSSSARAIHAKTGTLSRSIALSGYADSKTRGWLAFSIIVNNFTAPASEVEAWVDKIALALVE